jgi:hypothetical protein
MQRLNATAIVLIESILFLSGDALMRLASQRKRLPRSCKAPEAVAFEGEPGAGSNSRRPVERFPPRCRAGTTQPAGSCGWLVTLGHSEAAARDSIFWVIVSTAQLWKGAGREKRRRPPDSRRPSALRNPKERNRCLLPRANITQRGDLSVRI